MTFSPAPSHDWVDILQALLTPVIAFVAVGIAFAQWWTARQGLRLDLLDRRWAVYMAVRSLLAEMYERLSVSAEGIDAFQKGIRTCRWLFNEHVEHYVRRELWPQATALSSASSDASGSPYAERQEAARKKRGEIMDWMNHQDAVVDDLFGPFLTIDESFPQFLI